MLQLGGERATLNRNEGKHTHRTPTARVPHQHIHRNTHQRQGGAERALTDTSAASSPDSSSDSMTRLAFLRGSAAAFLAGALDSHAPLHDRQAGRDRMICMPRHIYTYVVFKACVQCIACKQTAVSSCVSGLRMFDAPFASALFLRQRVHKAQRPRGAAPAAKEYMRPSRQSHLL